MSKIFGIDVGNYATKSCNTSIISGYGVSSRPPFTGEEDCLFMNDKYYFLKSESFNYDADKTKDNRCVILTLFSIAEEILYVIKKANINYKDKVQEEISKIHDVTIAVGLPPLLLPTLKEATRKCYENFFADGDVKFRYKGYDFCLSMSKLYIFPQGASLVYQTFEDEILEKKYGNYIVVDIGGVTMDIIGFREDGKTPAPERCFTELSGSIKMYTTIRSKILSAYSINLTNSQIEDVLKGKPTGLDKNLDVKNAVIEYARDWTKEMIIDKCVENGIDFKSMPVVFMGGTSMLLHNFLEDKTFDIGSLHTYVTDTNANAKGYKLFARVLG